MDGQKYGHICHPKNLSNFSNHYPYSIATTRVAITATRVTITITCVTIVTTRVTYLIGKNLVGVYCERRKVWTDKMMDTFAIFVHI